MTGIRTFATADRRRWLALVILCLGQLMIVLDVTVVNVALPAIQRDLGFSPSALAWVVNGYLISFGGLLLLAGRIGDLAGRRRVFLMGVAMFTAASLLCGLAPSEGLLVAARFVQGAGAAVVASMVLAMLVVLFPEPRESAKAMSVYAFVASAGGTVGLILGGLLTQALSWHWIFFINVPVGVAAIALGGPLLPRDAGRGISRGVDVAGGLLVTAAPAVGVYTILDGASSGWTSARTLELSAVTAALVAAFLVREGTAQAPLVPLRVFRSRTLVGANVLRTLFPVGLFGTFYLGVLYLQNVLGYDALQTGLAFLPQTVMIAAFSLLLTRHVLTRLGARRTLVLGLALVAIGLALFARTPVGGRYVVDILPTTLLIGAGAGLFFMPSVSLAMQGADRTDAGLVSGLANVAVQIGGALGVAVLASMSSAHTARLVAGGAALRVAETGGYRLGFLIATGTLLTAIAVTLAVLRPARMVAGDDRALPERILIARPAPKEEAAPLVGAGVDV